MSYQLDFLLEANQDIEEAVEWYNKKKDNLGERFYELIKDKFNKLKDNPYLWSIRYDEVHCALVDIFPYLIHYIVEETNQRILVIGVLHTSKNPVIWKGRLS